MFATIYCLLYGDHHRLHKRLVQSLFRNLPHGQAHIVIWCNVVCDETRQWLQKNTRADCVVVHSESNVPKYVVMRELFYGKHAPKTPWIVWFDDDAYVVQSDWWQKTKTYIEEKAGQAVCYMGEPWFIHHLPGQQEFIKQATWYTGRPWQLCPTRSLKVKKPGVNFAQGSYWWLRTDTMRRLNWPDPRLNHNGGDTLLAEAVYQQELPFHSFHYGVKTNDAPRRGFHEKPAGSKV